MTFTEAVKTCYTKKYADFNGRASRSEFWWFFLFYAAVNLVLYAVFLIIAAASAANDPYSGAPAIAIVILVLLIAFDLASIVPYIAVAVRRLHDTGKPGTYFLLVLVPSVGGIIVLVLCALEPNRGPNMYGPDPLDPTSSSQAMAGLYAAQPYGGAQPAQPYGATGYPAQPYDSANPYAAPTVNPYAATGDQQPGSNQPYGQPYGAAPTGQPAASPYGQPSASQPSADAPFAAPASPASAAGGQSSQPSAPQPPAPGGDQQSYGFDFNKPEGYGTTN
ncbi:DUF805 domain-containing protein [Propionibacterium australiense]|uniref:DUF805 domain-containing protein n=1 Tax=Propionibacterium australiense TaxID=119981 RepID=A0A383S3H2_9ACTN|nr:DUF805 domain-containing protein [Propionibacterium australiense]RLP11956.1 DUF805 domain-containing protein [Propionibacterium australiense]RLP12593.1 DUF805 domain-containing protein [Propionibacterium australiense]SYZ32578.1 Protein of unknown function (DUF805) [Propionibacterium australiense]VEH91671.1 Inner membrane protein yhaI [Propionibacterium australiense]